MLEGHLAKSFTQFIGAAQATHLFGGRLCSGHALGKFQGRGPPTSAILDAVQVLRAVERGRRVRPTLGNPMLTYRGLNPFPKKISTNLGTPTRQVRHCPYTGMSGFEVGLADGLVCFGASLEDGKFGTKV